LRGDQGAGEVTHRAGPWSVTRITRRASVGVVELAGARFMSARFGTGHVHGVIQVATR